MEKTQKAFRSACLLLVLFAALDLVEFLVKTIVNGVDAMVMPPEIPEAMYGAMFAVMIVVGVVVTGLYALLGVWGLRKIKTRSTGIGHIVIGVIFAVLSAGGLFDMLGKLGDTANLFSNVLSLVTAAVNVIVLVFFVWYGLQFRKDVLSSPEE